MTVESIIQETAVTQDQNKELATLSLNDLVIVLQIIQAASSRGALKPEELSTVGGLYDKLVAFLEAAGALSKPGTETGPSTATAETPKENINA